MKDKLKKYRFAGIAVVVAILLAFGGDDGEEKKAEDAVVTTVETTTEATTVNSNQILRATPETTTEKATKKNSNKKSDKDNKSSYKKINKGVSLSDLPNYDGEPYVVINNNEPTFTKNEITTKSYEKYAELDALGRCGVAMACVGKDIMPTKERGAIGKVKPTGWHTVKYDCVDGKYLYNRCHLIGYQLTGENANERNLITGTRYMNVDGMLSFEDMVADYVKETNNHVMYRIIPIYKGNNLLASGVEMEAYSVEDKGEGISFHVYCYNVQPGVKINYKNGDSELKNGSVSEEKTTKKRNFLENQKVSLFYLYKIIPNTLYKSQ